MKAWFKYLIVAMTFTGWATAFSAPGKALLGHEFSLVTGQTVVIENTDLEIKFKAIIEDSRCPVNAVCVWPGNGQAEFEVTDIDGQRKALILNTSDEPKAVNLEAHRLKLIALSPPRIDGVSISPEEYAVTLRVDKKLPD